MRDEYPQNVTIVKFEKKIWTHSPFHVPNNTPLGFKIFDQTKELFFIPDQVKNTDRENSILP